MMVSKNQNTEMPLVSIAILSFNSEKFIYNCLRSVISQSYSNLEIIVFDDCSTDNSVAITEDFIACHSNVKLKLQKNQSNLGISGNSALALSLVSGDYIHLLAADDLMVPEKIEKQVNCLEKNKGFGFCFTNMEWKFSETLIPFKVKHYNIFSKVSIEVEDLISDYTIPTPTILWRKSAIKNITFRRNSELTADMLFTVEVSRRNKGFFLNENLLTYTRHAGNYSFQMDIYKERLKTKEALFEIFSKEDHNKVELYNDLLLHSLMDKNIMDNNFKKAFSNFRALYPVLLKSNKWRLRILFSLFKFFICSFRRILRTN